MFPFRPVARAALAGLLLAASSLPGASLAADFSRVASAVSSAADPSVDLGQLASLDPAIELMPLDMAHITSRYGHRSDPFKHRDLFHGGIDFGAPKGTPIHAVGTGKVILAGVRRGYGNVVVIEHRPGYRTLYAHASKLLVHAGQRVGAGDTIAKVGTTGHSTGPHLHFEVQRSGQRVNPAPYLAGL